MMNSERLQGIPPGPERDQFLPLLLVADESEVQVRSYYQHGDLFVLRSEAGDAQGITLAIAQPAGVVELKAVAIAPELQGRGVGQRMLALVLAELKAAGVRQVKVGTASCGIGQIAFYQKAGFRLRTIERDFFTVERGYRQGVEENGIPLRDMVWMDREL
jgi:ribosomal protein S18 acetylase RimI-like enzyme